MWCTCTVCEYQNVQGAGTSMISRKGKALPMDPNSPLNRAHQCERKADRMMNGGMYDLAMNCYKDASDYILQAMENTKDTVALNSLRLQKESYEKMPDLIAMKKQLDQKRSSSENIPTNVNNSRNGSLKLEHKTSNGETGEGVNGTEGCTDGELCLTSLEPVRPEVAMPLLANPVHYGRADSFESLPSTASEDTDSLLQCLKEHCELDTKQRMLYRPSQVLDAIRTFGRQKEKAEEECLQERPRQQETWKKMDKDDGTRHEELVVKNGELRKHVVNLLEQLESCERENARLKTSVDELTHELETQKSRSRGQSSKSTPDFGNELSVPFSLLPPGGIGMSTSATSTSSRIVVPQTPPALAPLEMPNFDDR